MHRNKHQHPDNLVTLSDGRMQSVKRQPLEDLVTQLDGRIQSYTPQTHKRPCFMIYCDKSEHTAWWSKW
eukprot:15354443-Ditylum_brightwellii.AAC.1